MLFSSDSRASKDANRQFSQHLNSQLVRRGPQTRGTLCVKNSVKGWSDQRAEALGKIHHTTFRHVKRELTRTGLHNAILQQVVDVPVPHVMKKIFEGAHPTMHR